MRLEIVQENNNQNLEEINSILSLDDLNPTSNKLACAGIYINKHNQLKVFVPEIKFSVYHGDQELIPETTTNGFVNFEMNNLPPQANARCGHSADGKGKYIFYTATDGKEVKLYHNIDSIEAPEEAKAYKIKWVSGTKKDGMSSPFGGGGSHSRKEDLLTDAIKDIPSIKGFLE